MSRVPTTNYLASADTTFEYATDDNDAFDRADITNLARAVDQHDHTPGRGLALTGDSFADNTITQSKIANGAVATAKVADAAITELKLAVDAVTTNKILNLAVTNAKIGNDAVTATKIADDAIGAEHLVDGAVGTVAVVDLAITTPKLAAGAVTTAKISDAQITDVKIADGHVTSAKILNGAVTTEKLAVGAVDNNRIALGAVGTNQLANGSIIAAKISDGQVTSAKLGADVVQVPPGAICAFDNQTDLTNAGAKWQTYTASAGRFLIGAGTLYSQTFTAQADVGTNWTPSSGLGVSGGGPHINNTFFATAVSSGSAGATVTASGSSEHAAPSLTNTSTPWIPPARVVIWGRRI